MIYLDDIRCDIDNFSDCELLLSSILTNDNRLNPIKSKEMDCNKDNSDIENFSDHELPLSSISNTLFSTSNHNILNYEVQNSETVGCLSEMGTEQDNKLDTNLKSKNKRTTIDNSIKKYECDICGKIFLKRNLIIEHFKTSLCFPECCFYFENESVVGKKSWYSRSDNNYLYCKSLDIELNNNIKYFNDQYYTDEICNNELIQHRKCFNTNEIELNTNEDIPKVTAVLESLYQKRMYSPVLDLLSTEFLKLRIINIFEFMQSNSMHMNYDDYIELCALLHKVNMYFMSRNKHLSGLILTTRYKRILNFEDSNQCSHKKFKTELDVSKSISKRHYESQNYECSKCSQIFYKRSDIISHIYNNHQEVYSKYSCDKCSKLYKYSQEFVLHMDKNRFKCSVCKCGQSFSTKSRLINHYHWHLGINLYDCKYCPKMFTKFSVYLCHERTHTGEKPFRCNFCDKWFPASSNFNIHLITHKSFCCLICQKAFDLMSLLLSHKAVHTQNEILINENYNNAIAQPNTSKILPKQFTGKEMVKFSVCFNSFIKLSALISHLKTHVSKNLKSINISKGIMRKLSLNKTKKIRPNIEHFNTSRTFTNAIWRQKYYDKLYDLVSEKEKKFGITSLSPNFEY